MLVFMHTCPWPVKMWTLGIAFMSEFIAVPSAHAARYRYVFGLVCAVLVSSVLPSMMFSVSKRSSTSCYIVQSVLYLAATHVILQMLSSYSAEHIVLLTYLLLSHFLSGQCIILRQHRRTLLYSSLTVHINVALICLLSIVCMVICPRVSMHLWLISVILFVPEVLGLCISAVYCVIKAIGDLYEECMSDEVYDKHA